MDSRGNIYPMNQDSASLVEAMGDALTEIPQEELESVFKMSRKQRRAWLRTFKKRGKGYTR